MKHLVIGNGEVGSAIASVFGGAVHDPSQGMEQSSVCEVMHVCIPYSDNFERIVTDYKERFKPSITVIHSTVPVGTSKRLDAVHSPIRGVHPHLEKGIRTFIKYLGGEQAEEAAQYFEEKGVKTHVVEDSNTTEAGKLWSTTQYGVFIAMTKEIKKWCDENNVDFETVYTHFNKTYNDGYKELGMEHVMRPVLKYVEGKIGGHCIVPNTKLFESDSCNYIQKYDT